MAEGFFTLKCIIIKPILIWIYKLVKSIVRKVKKNVLKPLFINSAKLFLDFV